MTNPFIIPSLANLNGDLAQRHFTLARGEKLQQAFAQLFSRHLGCMQSGKGFEARSLLVTGRAGSGKTAAISDMLNRFNETTVLLPDGKDARFAICVLEAKGSWKDLGRKTLNALGYGAHAARRTNSSSLQPPRTSANWSRSFPHRSNRKKLTGKALALSSAGNILRSQAVVFQKNTPLCRCCPAVETRMIVISGLACPNGASLFGACPCFQAYSVRMRG